MCPLNPSLMEPLRFKAQHSGQQPLERVSLQAFQSITVAHEVKKSVHSWQHNAEKGFLDMPPGATRSDTERYVLIAICESNCRYHSDIRWLLQYVAWH